MPPGAGRPRSAQCPVTRSHTYALRRGPRTRCRRAVTVRGATVTRWDRRLGRVRALLASGTERHRRHPRRPSGPGTGRSPPTTRTPRPWASRRPSGARRRSAGWPPEVLLFATAGPGLPRQDQRHRHPRRPRSPGRAAPTTRRPVRSGSGPCGPPRPWPATLVPWPCSSDVRTGLPGGADEPDSGDGAVAFAFGGPARAVVAGAGGHASATAEFLDRWRTPGEPACRSGRNASARRPTSRWPRPGTDRRLEAARADRRRRRPPGRRRLHARAGRRRFAASVCRPRPWSTISPRSGNLVPPIPGCCSPPPSTAPSRRGDRRRPPRRRRRRHRLAGDRCAAAVPGPGPSTGLAPSPSSLRRRRPRRRTPVPHLAGALRREPPRRPDPEAPASGPLAAQRGVEVRLLRLPLRGMRHPPPPPQPACACRLSHRGPHGPRRPVDVGGPGPHRHRRPAGLLASRRRWSSPCSTSTAAAGFRCELTDVDAGEVADRRPRRDDVPPPRHSRRDPQLLLEGPPRAGWQEPPQSGGSEEA